jgi:hypothetical protein
LFKQTKKKPQKKTSKKNIFLFENENEKDWIYLLPQRDSDGEK